MNEPKTKDEPPADVAKRSPNECFLCGRRDSGTWHYVASLGRFVCDECFRRAMSTDRTPRPRP